MINNPWFIVENGRFFEIHTYIFDSDNHRWEKTVAHSFLSKESALTWMNKSYIPISDRPSKYDPDDTY